MQLLPGTMNIPHLCTVTPHPIRWAGLELGVWRCGWFESHTPLHDDPQRSRHCGYSTQRRYVPDSNYCRSSGFKDPAWACAGIQPPRARGIEFVASVAWALAHWHVCHVQLLVIVMKNTVP